MNVINWPINWPKVRQKHALALAQEIWGQNGAVELVERTGLRLVGVRRSDLFHAYGSGRTWKEAFEAANTTPRARFGPSRGQLCAANERTA